MSFSKWMVEVYEGRHKIGDGERALAAAYAAGAAAASAADEASPAQGDVMLPCPFCGSPGHVTEIDWKHTTMCYATCSSLDCFCVVGEGYNGQCEPSHAFETKRGAVLAWNNRKHNLEVT